MAWRQGTGGPYHLLSDDVRWTITGNSLAARTYPGRDAFMTEVIGPFNARMQAPLVPTVRRLYAEQDTVIAFFDAAGVARDGRPYNNTYAWFLQMTDGCIVRAEAFFDSIAFDDLWRRVTPMQTSRSTAGAERRRCGAASTDVAGRGYRASGGDARRRRRKR